MNAQLIGIAVLALLVGIVLAQWGLKRRARRFEGQTVMALSPEIDACLLTRGRVLLYFFSPNCGPCRTMAPRIDAVAARHDNVFKLDVSQSLDVARKLGVMATPTTVLVAGDRIERIDLGPLSEQDIEARLTA